MNISKSGNYTNLCTGSGVCGKISDLQDLLIAALQGLSAWTVKAYQNGIIDHQVNHFSPRILFSTLTNVNFDSSRIIAYTREKREALKIQCLAKDPTIIINHPMAELQLFSDDPSELQYQAAEYALNKDKEVIGENILGLRLLCLYGLKGAAAYMEHARVLGQYNNDIYYQYHKIMAWLGSLPSDMDALFQCAMEIGQMNFKVMGILDAGATDTYGHPIPTQVNVKPIAGKCILVSGHDLKDLHNLLQQTTGTGINIFTHGEMLPAHGYPAIHKFKHLAGNYGGGWQDQQIEFAQFPGPIIMTSNCIIDPFVGNYSDRIWSRSIVGWPEINHLEGNDFSPVIAMAQQMAGFPYSEIEHKITVGFGRHTLLDATDTLIELINSKKLRRIFLVGGCDGARANRSYFTNFATHVPNDCIILTLACGKYRFNKLDFGEIAGLPRLIDVGQFNDAYGAIILATKLAKKLSCNVNDLPLSLVFSWFEQKAIAILLTLLSIGITNIIIGPTTPAFLTPDLLTIFEKKFGLRKITNVEQDMWQLLSA
ncbi:hydroxylamine reductase [Arsenophonus sp. PmNCSU2021_1]|uniref:hydroxylamine reductase n=1 Tax=Arsenophonus sp. PmNCSU2021_1 TaxID=3118989 RepID=UPI002FEEC66C